MTNLLSNFRNDLNVVVIGAAGGIGQAFVKHLINQRNVKTVYAFSRKDAPLENDKITRGILDLKNESTIEAAATLASDKGSIDIIIVATGLLHNDKSISPEKSLRDINANSFADIFAINTTGPALIMKHFLPKLSKDTPTVFAVLSARVGSISDNHLGGWYAYRASKSALNMLIRTASIEVSRRFKHAAVIGLHPGTVDTNLSEPFKANVAPDKLFTPEFSAESLLKVINNIKPAHTGKVFAWDAEEIPC